MRKRILNPFDAQVLIFFSVDCVDSTLLKRESKIQNQKVSIVDWAPEVLEFYQEFQQKFVNKKRHLWKYNGDEILFFARVLNWSDALEHVLFFQKLIQEQNEKDISKVKVKGTVWTAGFPVNNFILCPPIYDMIDFIGPDIDMGFRTTAFAQQDRIAISPELAYEIIAVSKVCQNIQWYYYGRQKLKGIPEREGIPIVYLSGRKDSLLDSEDVLLGKSTNTKDLLNFLSLYMDQSKVCSKRTLYDQKENLIENDIAYSEMYSNVLFQLNKLYYNNIPNHLVKVKKPRGAELKPIPQRRAIGRLKRNRKPS